MSIAPLLNQSYPYKHNLNKLSMKLLFLMWWIIGSSVLTAVTEVSTYSALLTSEDPINTLDEMLKLGYSFEVKLNHISNLK